MKFPLSKIDGKKGKISILKLWPSNICILLKLYKWCLLKFIFICSWIPDWLLMKFAKQSTLYHLQSCEVYLQFFFEMTRILFQYNLYVRCALKLLEIINSVIRKTKRSVNFKSSQTRQIHSIKMQFCKAAIKLSRCLVEGKIYDKWV